MAQLVSMLLVLAALAFLAYKSSPRVLLSPQLGFVACFIPAVAYAFFFVDAWSLDFALPTVLTVTGGCAWLLAVSVFTAACLRKTKKGKEPLLSMEEKKAPDAPFSPCIEVRPWKSTLFLVFQAVTLVLTALFLLRLYGENDLLGAISHYNDLLKFSDEPVSYPSLLGKMRLLSFASAYIWSYLLIHSAVYKYANVKNTLLFCANITLAVLNTVINGSRTEVFALAVAALIQFYFIRGKKNGYRLRLSGRYGALIGGAVALLILSFQAFGNLLGRGSEVSLGEYIGIYLSAELKNLDIFIREGNFGAPLSRSQTLIYLVHSVGGLFGLPSYKLDIPFRSVNGRELGNVATTFYAFLYDGGYGAVAFFVALMAVVSQLVFFAATRDRGRENTLSLSLLAYSYLFFQIVFSFFSNKFFENVFAVAFLYILLFWVLLRLYFEWLSIKNVQKLLRRLRRFTAGRGQDGERDF